MKCLWRWNMPARRSHTGGRSSALHVLEPIDFQHWVGVGAPMKEEQRQDAEDLMHTYMSRKSGRLARTYSRDLFIAVESAPFGLL